MTGSDKTVIFANLILEVLEFLGVEFNYVPADVTDHVVVMGMPISVFINVTFVGSGDPLDQTALYEKAQCPVYRGPGCFRPGVFYPEIEEFRFEMAVEGKDLAEDRGALFCQFKPLSPEKIPEDNIFHAISLTEIETELQLNCF